MGGYAGSTVVSGIHIESAIVMVRASDEVDGGR
ncbi:MAG: hypothetical protein ACJAZO_003442 [Myxococcota bacterium]|jgi:hypothetical protein